jgi:hypothetical protein
LRAIMISLLTLCMALALGRTAHAALLKAVRPGVMCASAEALAELTLPDGNSRSAIRGALPKYKEAAKAGGCIAIGKNIVVATEAIRKNTSIVTYHSFDSLKEGRFYVPNIDFVRFTPPDTVFYREIRRKCPRKLNGIYVYDSIFLIDIQSLFIATLPKGMQGQIFAAVKGACETDDPCDYKAIARKESELHLDARHADFLCALKGFPAASK